MPRIGLAAFVLLLPGAFSHADERSQARAILQHALHAVGEDHATDRPAGEVWKAKVTLHGLGDSIVYTGKWMVGSPRRVCVRMTGIFHGRPFVRQLTIRDDRGWINQDGKVQELDQDRLAEEKERLHAAWVTTLLPLRRMDFDLTPLSRTEAGRGKTGLRVHQAGHRDVMLYFDNAGRLVESQTNRKDPATGDVKTETVRYKTYQPFGRVQHAAQLEVLVDGKLLAEIRITDYTRGVSLDDDLFGRPAP